MHKINCADLSVLVVDDQKMARELVHQNLVKMGFTKIDMAESGTEAESMITADKYDMIFLDWLMPGKSGLAMLQDYREKREFDHVAFIMITAKAADWDVSAALKAGATSYIVKPTLPKEFAPNVQLALEWMAKVNPKFKDKA